MIRRTWLVLGLVGAGAIAPFLISPAHACTPHPDNPSGCDRINRRYNIPAVGSGGWDDPWPPNCPQCGKLKLNREDLILPADRFRPQGNFGQQMLNPQPLPPKAVQTPY
ncbi:hypothetical protein [Altericista sp. CCNU0014]|uniref:hypothetical protein n=1 Tax=Altericista sp. CCNU0014 TaxID=3082949 RepID=UPI00384AF93F